MVNLNIIYFKYCYYIICNIFLLLTYAINFFTVFFLILILKKRKFYSKVMRRFINSSNNRFYYRNFGKLAFDPFEKNSPPK
jgi:hypothetical protein